MSSGPELKKVDPLISIREIEGEGSNSNSDAENTIYPTARSGVVGTLGTGWGALWWVQ